MAVAVDEDLRARNAIVIAKTCYYHDVRFAGPGGAPLFDDLITDYQLKYLDLAESILFNLETVNLDNGEYIG